jgi:hypothetical protein
MANRTMICPAYGFMHRTTCDALLLGYPTAQWPRHCHRPMLVLGYRQSQAATQLTESERVRWGSLGGPISKWRGRKRWRPILTEARLEDRYPLGYAAEQNAAPAGTAFSRSKVQRHTGGPSR